MQTVLMLTSSFPTFLPGDATFPFVYELAKNIQRQKKVQVVILTQWRTGAKRKEIVDGIIIHRFFYGFTGLSEGAILPNLRNHPLLWLQVPFFFIFLILNIHRLVRLYDCRVIHAHWLIPQGLAAALYAKLTRRKLRIICTALGADVFSLQHPIARAFKRFIVRNVDVITMVTSDMQHEIQSLQPSNTTTRCIVVPTAADHRLFFPERRDPTLKARYGIKGSLLLFVGRLAEKKGVKYLLDAMPEVLAKRPDAQLVLIGSGPLAGEIQKQIQGLGVAASVHCLGALPNHELPVWFASANLFVAPSIVARDGDSEGLPVVIIEAMLSGTCVVTSDLPALADIVIDHETGLRVHVQDTKIFSKSLLALLEDETLRRSLAEAGFKKASESFSLESIARTYTGLYTELSSNI